jgi:hypothetical protein
MRSGLFGRAGLSTCVDATRGRTESTHCTEMRSAVVPRHPGRTQQDPSVSDGDCFWENARRAAYARHLRRLAGSAMHIRMGHSVAVGSTRTSGSRRCWGEIMSRTGWRATLRIWPLGSKTRLDLCATSSHVSRRSVSLDLVLRQAVLRGQPGRNLHTNYTSPPCHLQPSLR